MRIILSIISSITMLSALVLIAFAPAAQAKYASIVLDANSGNILHEVNANTRNYPASLTKMMTLYMLFEALEAKRMSLNTKIYFSARAAARPPTKLGIGAGDSIRAREAIGALIVKSANDAATAVAEHIGKSESNFAKMMTRKAKELGMHNTRFRNASGLPNKSQLSTARDMAILVQALQRHFPQYYRFFSLRSVTIRGKTYKSHNKLLGNYSGSDGVKTGYTRASGFNLAASVERNGVRLIGVVFGGRTGKSRDAHMKKLLDESFARAKILRLARAPIPPHWRATTQIASAAPQLTEIAEITAPEQEPQGSALEASPQAHNESVPATGSARELSPRAAYHAPPLPAAYWGDGLARTTIAHEPYRIALVQNFKTGVPRYDGGGWSVQVGAYRRLSQAAGVFNKILAHTQSPYTRAPYEKVILGHTERRNTIYKIRLVGLQKNEAYRACSQFKRRQIDCLVISPHGG